jgi:hypothetical protein
MRTSSLLPVLLLLLASLTGCRAVFGPDGATVAERRANVLRQRDELIAALSVRRPRLAEEVHAAAGYAYFAKSNLQLLIFSSENAYGVVTEPDGTTTFMRMYGSGAGFGVGVHNFKVLMIFRNRKVLDDFITHGMDIRGTATAGVKLGDLEASSSNAESLQDIDVYQLTELGGAFQITLQANKFWIDSNLN